MAGVVELPEVRACVFARPASTRCPGAQGVVQGNTISAGWWWRWRRRGRWEGRIWRRRTLCIIQAGLQRRVGLALTPECTKVKDLVRDEKKRGRGGRGRGGSEAESVRLQSRVGRESSRIRVAAPQSRKGTRPRKLPQHRRVGPPCARNTPQSAGEARSDRRRWASRGWPYRSR